MTDQTIPAGKLREIIEKMHDHANDPYVDSSEKRNIVVFADQLAALLPAPPRPTLADMTPKEREACQWMQCDITGGDEPLVIARLDRSDDTALILGRNGQSHWTPAYRVTPRPDLPRLTWPSDEKDEPAPVPPSTMAVGSEWDDADALARECRESGRDQIVVTDKDGDVFVWDADAEWWAPVTPADGYEPYTIIHTGKGGDQ